MMARGSLLEEIRQVLSTHGLALRGGLDFAADEKAPAGPSGRQARSVVLVGNAGDRFWPHFRAWLADQPSGLPDPLDAWSRQVLEAVSLSSGARVVMPNERPFQPFQQWAKRAEGLNASPLGILIHPEFGLWHAYRGALLFDRPLAAEEGERSSEVPIHLCETCVGKPCLNACPVGAFGDGFDYRSCLSHIVSPGGASCMDGGCLARNACPHDGYRYGVEFQGFLMNAFRDALRQDG